MVADHSGTGTGLERAISSLLEQYARAKADGGTGPRDIIARVRGYGAEAVPLLGKSLACATSPDLRRAAALLLGETGHSSALEPLAGCFPSEQDRSVRSAALAALSKLVAVVLNELAVLPAADVRREALKADLAKLLETDVGLAAVASQLEKSPDRNVRRGAVEALSCGSGPKIVGPLVQALADADWLVRAGAARCLGKIGDRRAAGALAHHLADSSWHVRRDAAVALAALGDGRARGPLMEYLESDDPADRALAVSGLTKLHGDDIAPRLIRALKDVDRFVRRNAADGLRVIGADEAINAISEALAAESDAGTRDVMKRALNALRRLHAAPSLRLVVEASGKLHLLEWENITVTIVNEGKGAASDVTVAATGPAESNVQAVGPLPAGASRQVRLPVRVKEVGRSVPVELQAVYKDEDGNRREYRALALLWVIDPDRERSAAPQVVIQGDYYGGDHIADSVVKKDNRPEKPPAMQRLCPHCGHELSLIKLPGFCPYCGQRLVE